MLQDMWSDAHESIAHDFGFFDFALSALGELLC